MIFNKPKVTKVSGERRVYLRREIALGICLLFGSYISYSQSLDFGKKANDPLKYTLESFLAVEDSDYSDFNLILHQDLEDTPVGVYSYDDWQNDWGNMTWAHGVYTGDRTIIEDCNAGERRTNCMKWTFPEGTFSMSKEHGYAWKPEFEAVEECYLSYSIMFKPGFKPNRGGKIPGFAGGPKQSGPPLWDQGFSGSLIFKEGAPGVVRPAFYIYHHDMPITVGEIKYWEDYSFDVSTDTWYDISYRVVMNTATATNKYGPDGLKDGILEAYVNGKLVGQWTGLRLRNVADIGIDVVKIQGYFGGGDERWNTLRDEWMRIDNVYIWNYSDKFLSENPSIKRGQQSNTLGDSIYTPFDILFGNTYENPEDSSEADNIPPTVPTSVLATDSTQTTISLSWEPATDNVDVAGYRIYVNNLIYGSTGLNTYKVNGLDPSSEYFLSVSAFDAELNESPKSTALVAYTKLKDITPPTVPSGLTAEKVTSNSVELSWDPSTDEYGIERYEIFLDGISLYSTDQTYLTLPNLQANTTYSISVSAHDPYGNRSPPSDDLRVTTDDTDTEPPSTPSGLIETGVTQTTIDLRWSPSTDNQGIQEYLIYVNHTEWEVSLDTLVTVDRLQQGIEYDISVSAVDLAGNKSRPSSSIKVATTNGDVTSKPTMPQISIIQVHDQTISPRSISEMKSLGFTELKNFGLQISEPASLGKESLILTKTKTTQVINGNRVTSGLTALYNFSEGTGSTVKDKSANNPELDLHISEEGLDTEWLVGQGLRITGNTSISFKGQTDELIDSLSANNEITLEAWIKQELVDLDRPASIIALSGDSLNNTFSLVHEGNEESYHYVTHLNTSDSLQNAIPDLRTDQDFITTSLHHVVYTRNNSGKEQIYINGLLLASGMRTGDFSPFSEDCQFILANEINGDKPWKGIFYLVALYNKALSSKEINQNYQAGFGQIRFITELDTLETNVDYKLTPFVKTNLGIIYGQPRDLRIRNTIEEQENLLSMYPNPSNGHLNLTIRNTDEYIKECYIRIADFSGKVHYMEKIDLSEGLLEKRIEMEIPGNIPDGLYSVILTTPNKSVAEKLVLMR